MILNTHASIFSENMVLVIPKCTAWRCMEVGKKFIAGMQNGDTEPTNVPKAVHASDPLFLDCNLPTFREASTRKRAKAGSFLSSRKQRSCLSMLARAQLFS